MSDTTIFIFGCGVMGVVLASIFIMAIAGNGTQRRKSTEVDHQTQNQIQTIRAATKVESIRV